MELRNSFKIVNNLFQVLHSQKMSATPASPWLIAEMDGNILTSHCDCMAGLGESCSHMAAVLFYIEYAARLQENKTVTQDKAYWMPPALKEVKYNEIKGIDFMSSKSIKRKMDLQLLDASK